MAWLILGGGTSGLGAALLLGRLGERVRLSEQKRLAPAVREGLESLGVEICDGGHSLSHLDGYDNLVVSPGIRPDHALLIEARARKVRVLTELDLALTYFRGTLVAITGTNGKSTTAVMTAQALTSAGLSAVAGGNLGEPPTRLLAEGKMAEILVLEVSSYQLEGSRPLRPSVAMFTSFSHDHTDRHGTLDAYFLAKWKIFEAMPETGLAIMPDWIYRKAVDEHGLSLNCQKRLFTDEDSVRDRGKSTEEFLWLSRSKEIFDGTGKAVLNLNGLGIDVPHNLVNAAYALIGAGWASGRLPRSLTGGLAGFQGLPHRCERVGVLGNVVVWNDSKSTNVESTLIALAAMNGPVLLLLGGKGKGESFSPVLRFRSKIRAVIAFGASGHEIVRDLGGDLPVTRYDSLSAALSDMKRHLAQDGEILFSPACASFDEFRNFEERGELFQKAFRSWLDG